jgi:uncharacterized membrane protein YkvA (DUF1232 family)
VIDTVLHDIPIEYRDRFRQLLDQPAEPVPSLRAEVQRYIATVKQIGLMVKLLDIGAAERLAEVSVALLDHLTDAHPPEAKLLVNAAVRYFVREEDDEEVTGVLGFDDDVQVINAVSRMVGRTDLVIPLSDLTDEG